MYIPGSSSAAVRKCIPCHSSSFPWGGTSWRHAAAVTKWIIYKRLLLAYISCASCSSEIHSYIFICFHILTFLSEIELYHFPFFPLVPPSYPPLIRLLHPNSSWCLLFLCCPPHSSWLPLFLWLCLLHIHKSVYGDFAYTSIYTSITC